jgi:hypothetical protein
LPWKQRADINESIQRVLERLQNSDCRLLSITDSDRQVGIVNIDNFVELIKIQGALQDSATALMPSTSPRSA